jgi:hypothetical protein
MPARPGRLQARQVAPALSCLAVLVSLGVATSALGRSAGIAAGDCENCHSGGDAPTITVTAEPPYPAIGQWITLTVAVSQTNGSPAGFYLTTSYNVPGTFKAVESGTSGSGSGVLHTMPRIGSGGVTTFKAQWSTSQATGVAFDVFAVSANGDKTNRGDGAGLARLQLAVGCTGTTYYIDQDSDGYGSTDPAYQTREDCTQPPGYAAISGDCDDFQAQKHPNALEQCDMKDNDCNGQVDDNVVYQAFCQDQDGDGHGVLGAATKMDCKPSVGFGDFEADCDDRDVKIHPGVAETCDGRDNDCDGKIDEGARVTCGVGLCARYAVGCSNACTPGEPFAETCDGYDDDCDGEVDEGTSEALCGDATLACLNGRCTGENGAGSVAGMGPGSSPGGGFSGSAGAGPFQGLPAAADSSGGCALSSLPGHGRTRWWLPLGAALLLSLRQRRRSPQAKASMHSPLLPPA